MGRLQQRWRADRCTHQLAGRLRKVCSPPQQQFSRYVSPAAVLPRLSVRRVDVPLDEFCVSREPELDGCSVSTSDVGVIGVDEYAVGFRPGAGAVGTRGRVGRA